MAKGLITWFQRERLAAVLEGMVYRIKRVGDSTMQDEASYTCDSCGEEIVVPIDLSAGTSQDYVEDCPVCCCPNLIHVQVEEDGDVQVWAQRE
jgi:hypothetical protein